MYIFADPERGTWEGTSADLERVLRDNVKSENLQWLFYYPGACGQYLATLAPKVKGEIEFEKVGGNKNWYTIYRPTAPADDTSSS
jgi:hypothetical protein